MKNTNARLQNTGFTLVELTIVLVVVALLLGGLMSTMSVQVEQQKIRETQKLLDDAKDALIGFAAANGRLPCPANPATASGTVGAGIEYPATVAGCTTSVQGSLPWVTLGLTELDGWGQRLSYRVTAGFARTAPAFSLASNGDINLLVTSGGASIANNAPVVIVSHGKNGFGAYLPSGLQAGASIDADELENTDIDLDFVNKTPTANFDDIVTWISPNILFNRMIAAGKLP